MPLSERGKERKSKSGRREMQRDRLMKRKGNHQTCQKGNLLPCPYPYVTKVMFHDIHLDSDTCQPEVLALFPPARPSGALLPVAAGEQDGEEKK